MRRNAKHVAFLTSSTHCINCREDGLVCSSGYTSMGHVCPRCGLQMVKSGNFYEHKLSAWANARSAVSTASLVQTRTGPRRTLGSARIVRKMSCSAAARRTDKRCSRLEAVPNVNLDFFNDHERNCLERCRNCIRTNVPCQFLTGKSICSNCTKEHWYAAAQ